MSKPRVPKLTEEELSRVLGQAAIGKLDHDDVYNPTTECGCIASAALACGEKPCESLNSVELSRLWLISAEVNPTINLGQQNYPEGPDAILRYLESRGLA